MSYCLCLKATEGTWTDHRPGRTHLQPGTRPLWSLEKLNYEKWFCFRLLAVSVKMRSRTKSCELPFFSVYILWKPCTWVSPCAHWISLRCVLPDSDKGSCWQHQSRTEKAGSHRSHLIVTWPLYVLGLENLAWNPRKRVLMSAKRGSVRDGSSIHYTTDTGTRHNLNN